MKTKNNLFVRFIVWCYVAFLAWTMFLMAALFSLFSQQRHNSIGFFAEKWFYKSLELIPQRFKMIIKEPREKQ